MTRTLDPERLNDHVDRLHRAARAMCGNPHDAEDLVQETYARLLARPRHVRGPSDVGYLLTALRNTYVNRSRAQLRSPLQVGLPEDRDLPSADRRQEPDRLVEAREALAAVQNLPAPLAAAIMAVDVVGLTFEEAGKVTGQDPRALAGHLARARIAVARRLAPEHAVRGRAR